MKTDSQKLLEVAKVLQICERLKKSLIAEAEDRNSPKLAGLFGSAMREEQMALIGQSVAVSVISKRLRGALDLPEDFA